jgi:hypothetical protein
MPTAYCNAVAVAEANLKIAPVFLKIFRKSLMKNDEHM